MGTPFPVPFSAYVCPSSATNDKLRIEFVETLTTTGDAKNVGGVSYADTEVDIGELTESPGKPGASGDVVSFRLPLLDKERPFRLLLGPDLASTSGAPLGVAEYVFTPASLGVGKYGCLADTP